MVSVPSPLPRPAPFPAAGRESTGRGASPATGGRLAFRPRPVGRRGRIPAAGQRLERGPRGHTEHRFGGIRAGRDGDRHRVDPEDPRVRSIRTARRQPSSRSPPAHRGTGGRGRGHLAARHDRSRCFAGRTGVRAVLTGRDGPVATSPRIHHQCGHSCPRDAHRPGRRAAARCDGHIRQAVARDDGPGVPRSGALPGRQHRAGPRVARAGPAERGCGVLDLENPWPGRAGPARSLDRPDQTRRGPGRRSPGDGSRRRIAVASSRS